VIDVALTPAHLRRCQTTVVIDVLRATSTAVTALAAGYRRVRVVPDVETALGLRGRGRVLAGEYRYVTPAEFDQGNSPADAARRRGDELVLATTNGTPAIVAAVQVSETVLLGSMLNLAATAELLADREGDVQLLCSGSQGAVALEDVYVAGRLATLLSGRRSDAALLAEATSRRYDTPLCALQAGAAAARLRAAGVGDDIADCARESVLEVVAAVAVADRGCTITSRPAARRHVAATPPQQRAEVLSSTS
jgi:2-phosphosulfolactate phosphatase